MNKHLLKWIYPSLWLIRVYFAMCGAAYIHPDEHMQNAEVSAGVLGYYTHQTWEWNPSFPVRSIIPPFITTATPMLFLNLILSDRIHPAQLFYAGRLLFLALSMLLDYILIRLIAMPDARRLGLLLLASSHVVLTFQVRPFSNSIESVLVASSLALLRRVVSVLPESADKRPMRALCGLAVLFVAGTFARPTFLVFASPIAWQVVRWSIKTATLSEQGNALLQLTSWLQLVVLPFVTAIFTSACFISIDSAYFRGDIRALVVTPLNFLLYNFSPENLAGHGLHPRWLHLFVNIPILIGPWIMWFVLHTIYQFLLSSDLKGVHQKDVATQTIDRTIIYMAISSISILSIQPHQELRFITPLFLPIIVLVSNSGQIVRVGKVFWLLWIISNSALAVMFGILHQGGVVPSLLHLHDKLMSISSSQPVHIIYWKTYMPPRYLLGIHNQDYSPGQIHLTDLAGAPRDGLFNAVTSAPWKNTCVITPIAMHSTLPDSITKCTTLGHRVFPHLDLDHISESVQAGWRDGLTLGVYDVDTGCVESIDQFQ
ncbi:glycosyltransferase family 22 protein [Hygrophoropsis aurantiaca]|uniref:Glycosyltransferase family 22 protein n=1 Tax=Hygrophoropsis aurantiaca TaxID=72124 RepID=A0ACB8AC54_9AGAM|nr:glycosyltransferase family 22 protein [Hygrophoropsis aurantiaca]